MLTDDVRGLASRIAEHLATESRCLFRDVPPADQETLLGVGLVLALMRQRATAESDPVFSFFELDNLVGNALHSLSLNISTERFLERISCTSQGCSDW